MLGKVERLEQERQDLLKRTERAEKAQVSFDERFGEVGLEFASLANLFVASNQLHASLTPRGVVRRIKEILAQLVGAEAYAMYIASSDGKDLVPVASEGVPGEFLVSLPFEGSTVGAVVHSRQAVIDEDRDTNHIDFDHPPVIIPLGVDETSVGAIVIYGTWNRSLASPPTDFEALQAARSTTPPPHSWGRHCSSRLGADFPVPRPSATSASDRLRSDPRTNFRFDHVPSDHAFSEPCPNTPASSSKTLP